MKAMLALRWRYRLLMGLLPALSLNPTPEQIYVVLPATARK
jgi:hypothetical protein